MCSCNHYTTVVERSINKIDLYSNPLPHKYEQYWTALGYIMQSRTILVLRLIPDKGRSKALPLFIAMRGISNNFLVHLPSWHDELRVCKEKQIKLLLMFQNVIHWRKLQIRNLFHYQYEDWKSSVGEI